MTSEKLGLYVHWPYCSRICPYCDFNVVRHRDVDEAAWEKVLTDDLRYWHTQTGGRPLTSLYFGGGTPSLMPSALAQKVIDTCASLWGFIAEPEITLEANPTDAEAGRFADFAQAGVNRLSLGVQSLRADALQFLGRNHSADEVMTAIGIAQTNFQRLTFDLIYARPEQSLDAWQIELEEALATGVTHLSAYQLTVEPGTAFEKAVARNDWQPKSDDQEAAFYDLTQDICEAYGLPAYEVSNHAKPGDESLHNHLYWTYQDYIGIGPGAHGRISNGGKRLATESIHSPQAYLNGKPATRYTTETIPAPDQGIEYLSMALRLAEGADADKFARLSGQTLPEEKLDQLFQDRLVKRDRNKIGLTKSGRKVLNQVVLELLS